MPLGAGKSHDVISKNVEELMRAYKATGKIGNTHPRDMAHARRIASAAALSKVRGKSKPHKGKKE